MKSSGGRESNTGLSFRLSFVTGFLTLLHVMGQSSNELSNGGSIEVLF